MLEEGKIATAEDAARADRDPPLDRLIRLINEDKKVVEKGESVIYWMRLEDVRSKLRIAVLVVSIDGGRSRRQYWTVSGIGQGKGAQDTTRNHLRHLSG